jgi:hypothetical protein
MKSLFGRVSIVRRDLASVIQKRDTEAERTQRIWDASRSTAQILRPIRYWPVDTALEALVASSACALFPHRVRAFGSSTQRRGGRREIFFGRVTTHVADRDR